MLKYSLCVAVAFLMMGRPATAGVVTVNNSIPGNYNFGPTGNLPITDSNGTIVSTPTPSPMEPILHDRNTGLSRRRDSYLADQFYRVRDRDWNDLQRMVRRHILLIERVV